MSENKEFTETAKKQILEQLETIKTEIEKQQEIIKELEKENKDTIELYKKIDSLLQRLDCDYCAALHATTGEWPVYTYEVNEVLHEIRKRLQ